MDLVQGNELVGVATPIELNNETLYFLTISSNAIGALRFETEKGTPLTTEMVIRYVADSHHGSLKSPVILHNDNNRPYKIIENDHVIIIRDGERYDVTGRRR